MLDYVEEPAKKHHFLSTHYRLIFGVFYRGIKNTDIIC